MEVQENNPLDIQIAGNHYDFKIQPIEFAEINKLTFSEGNVVKYILRHKRKNGVEDLKKAKHYLEFVKKFHDTKVSIRVLKIQAIVFCEENGVGKDEAEVIKNLCLYVETRSLRPLSIATEIVNKMILNYDN